MTTSKRVRILHKGISEENLKALFHTTISQILKENYGKETLIKQNFEGLMKQFGMQLTVSSKNLRNENTSGSNHVNRKYVQILTVKSNGYNINPYIENPWNHEKICRKVIRQRSKLYEKRKRKISLIHDTNTQQNYESRSRTDNYFTSDSNNFPNEYENHFISSRQQIKFLENQKSQLQKSMISYESAFCIFAIIFISTGMFTFS